jgi:hypothetical protein
MPAKVKAASEREAQADRHQGGGEVSFSGAELFWGCHIGPTAGCWFITIFIIQGLAANFVVLRSAPRGLCRNVQKLNGFAAPYAPLKPPLTSSANRLWEWCHHATKQLSPGRKGNENIPPQSTV